MTKNKFLAIRILLIFSAVLNVIFFIHIFPYSEYQKQDSSELVKSSVKDYELKNEISYNQIFYGKWKVIECIPADLSLPSSYSGFDEYGNFRGPNLTKIIGEEIIFEEEFAEYLGEKHQYVYGPKTYTLNLHSDQEKIGYNYAKTLGIIGNYYSIIYFLLPDNYQVANKDNYLNEIRIDDLCYLYLRDNDTIYASNGVITYLLKRLSK